MQAEQAIRSTKTTSEASTGAVTAEKGCEATPVHSGLLCVQHACTQGWADPLIPPTHARAHLWPSNCLLFMKYINFTIPIYPVLLELLGAC